MSGLSCGLPFASKIALHAVVHNAFAARPYTVSVGKATGNESRIACEAKWSEVCVTSSHDEICASYKGSCDDLDEEEGDENVTGL